MDPVLEKMKEHLITKNVAAEIAEKLCNSVAAKLEGKTIGTFSGELGAERVKDTRRGGKWARRRGGGKGEGKRERRMEKKKGRPLGQGHSLLSKLWGQ